MAKIARPFTVTTSNLTTSVSTTTAWSVSTFYAKDTEVADPNDSTQQYTAVTGYTESATCSCASSTEVVTWTGNSLSDNDEIYFATSFGGVSAGIYYVINHGGGNTFQISASEGGGSVNFTSNDTETCYANPGGRLNLGNALTDSTHWVASGPTNFWAMHDGYSTDQTESNSDILVTFDLGTERADSVVMLDMENITRVTMSANVAGGTIQGLNESEDFTDAYWTKTEMTISGDSDAGPAGTGTADTLVPSATNTAGHKVRPSSSGISGGTVTFSVYLKAAGYNYALLRVGDSAESNYFQVSVDLTDGSVGTVSDNGTATGISATSEQIADYYRISVTGSGSGSWFPFIYVFNSSGHTSFSGDTSSGIYAWGAQLEAGSSATDYVEMIGGAAQNTYVYFKSFSMVEEAFSDEWYSTAGHYTETRYKRAFGVTDIPPKSGMDITVGAIVTGTGKIGLCKPGLSNDMGGAQYGASLGIRNYSDISRDTFGTVSVTERAYSNKGSFEVWVENDKADAFFDILTAFRAMPLMWFMIPDGSIPGWAPRGLFYGIYTDFEEIVRYPTTVIYNLELEGLGNG